MITRRQQQLTWKKHILLLDVMLQNLISHFVSIDQSED